jgi:hypothetical protein
MPPVPLQLPGVIELVIALFVFVVGLAIVIGATYWVYTDAKRRRNANPGIWAAITAIGFFVGLVPGIVVVVIYLFVRE